MTDNKNELLLRTLCDVCPADKYVVVSFDEVNARIYPPFAGESELEASLNTLNELKLINVKFAGGGEYCISVPEPWRNFYSSNKKTGFFARNRGLFATTTAAALGGLLGGLLAKFIF